jgi:hypothetical protein
LQFNLPDGVILVEIFEYNMESFFNCLSRQDMEFKYNDTNDSI